MIHLVFILVATLVPALAQAEVFWARPTGTHDISGSAAFCSTIRSTDTNHVGQTRANEPAAFGTVGAAVACAKVAGDVVNISGNHGIYNDTSTDRNTINTFVPSITPTFGLANGTVGNPTIVQTVPGDPKAEIRVRNGQNNITTYTGSASKRSYITWRNLRINGINSTQHSNFQTNCVYLFGDHLTVEDSDIYNCGGTAVVSHSAPTNQDCLDNHHHTIQRNRIFDAYSSTLGSGDGYAVYSSANDLVIDGNEIFRVESEFLQIYDSGGCDAARTIIRNNYMHDLKKGTAGSNNADRCGQAIAVNGSEGQIVNNVILADCPSDTGIGFEQGIGTGIGSCPTLGFSPGGYTGRFAIWNNVVYAPLGIGINIGGCVTSAGSQIINDVVLAATAFSGSGIGGTTQQTNRTSGVIGNCFDATFHLNTGSNPCVDGGTTVAITTDRDGETRTAPYDIGPDERSGGPPPDTTPPGPPTGVFVSKLERRP